MQPSFKENAPTVFSIYRASYGSLKNIDLALPHHSIVTLSGNGPLGKSSLVRGIVHGYSTWLLQELQSIERPSNSVPLIEGASGVLPTRSVEELCERLPTTQSIGEFLGIDSLLEAASERISRPSCDLPGCNMGDRSAGKTVLEIRNGVLAGGFERPIVVIGAKIEVPKERFSEALRHYINEGFKRFFLAGRLLRAAEASAMLESGGDELGEFYLVSETLSVSDATSLRLVEAIKGASTITNGTVIAFVGATDSLRFDGAPLNDSVLRWSIFDGFGCDLCSKRFFRTSTNSEALTLKVGGRDTTSLSTLSFAQLHELFAAEVQRLGTSTPLAVQLLVARLVELLELSLSDLSPEDRFADLAPASRYLIALAKRVPAGTLLLLDCPERILGSAAQRILLPWFQRRLGDGNSLLVATNAPDLIAVGSLRLSLSRQADGSVALHSLTAAPSKQTPLKRSPSKRQHQLKYRSHVAVSQEISILIGGITVLECPLHCSRYQLREELATHAKAASFRAIRNVSLDAHRTRASRKHELRISEQLGLTDSLAELFASSRAARSAGLCVDDFDRRSAGACDLCRGSGVNVIELDVLGQLAQQCRRCGGSGYDAKVSEVVVAGMTIAEASVLTLAQLRATLPLERPMLQRLTIAEQLSLGALTLDRRCADLAESERALLILTAALAAGQRRGKLLVVDALFDVLDDAQLSCAENGCLSLCRSGASVVVMSAHELAVQALHTRIDTTAR